MSPTISNYDFSGGVNKRDLGHLIAPNECTTGEGFNLAFKSVKTMPGDLRILIDAVTYPEVTDDDGAIVAGSGGGTPNGEPILGFWRYYYNDGRTAAANSWVRVHGTTCEYWNPTTGRWITIGAAWPAGAVPTAVQFENTIYILHGNAATGYTAKYLFSNGAAFTAGDVPVPAAPLAALRPSFAVTYKNRLYACDRANEPFRVRYSGVNLPQVWTAPNGGYITKGEDKGDYITGLFVHKDVLYIFKRSSVWRYWVDDYGTEHIGQVHGAAGCIAHRSICAYKDAIYYASDEGLIALYGADSDCVTHNIADDIVVDGDYLDFIQASVNAYTGTLWVSYLEAATTVLDYDECGDLNGKSYSVYHTATWRADIRRPNIIKPRWVKLPYYHITAHGIVPQGNNYRGNNTQHFRFAAQQPGVHDWNPTATVNTDPAFPSNGAGGPRHYCYVFGQGYDRDQIPAYSDACEDQLYAGDEGIGYWLKFVTPRYIPSGSMRDNNFEDVRIDYFIYKTAAATGIDAAWGRVLLDDNALACNDPGNSFPLQDTWWPIRDNSPSATAGGAAWTEWSLRTTNPSSGKSIQVEWNAVGTANRNRESWGIEFRFFGIGFDPGPDKYNPED